MSRGFRYENEFGLFDDTVVSVDHLINTSSEFYCNDTPNVTTPSRQFADIKFDYKFNSNGYRSPGNDVINQYGVTLPTTYLPGTGTGLSKTAKTLPVLPNVEPSTTVILDVLLKDKHMFFLRTSNDTETYYQGAYIDHLNLETGAVKTIYSALILPTTLYNGTWVDHIRFEGSAIVSSNEMFAVSVLVGQLF